MSTTMNEEQVLSSLNSLKMFRVLVYRQDINTFLALLDMAGFEKPSGALICENFENGIIIMYQCYIVGQQEPKSIQMSTYDRGKYFEDIYIKAYGKLRFFHPNGKFFEVNI